jgi:RHS repeat-associated protein
MDPLNRTTTYERNDTYGRVTKRTDPDGTETTWTYGLAGPLTITEPVTASPPMTRTSSIGYSPEGLPTSITDPRQKTTQLGYYSSGDLHTVTDPYSKTTTFGYNDLGWRTSVTDHLQHQSIIDYDARGRVLKLTNPAGKHIDFAYVAGWRTSVTDTLLRQTKQTYDPYGRLTVVEDAEGGLTRYDYDLMSNLTTLTDAENQATAFRYDSHGRVDRVTYPGGAYDSFTYDPVGRLSTKVDRKNVTTTFSYDDVDRLTGVSFSDGTPSLSYVYDPVTGRLASASNGTDTLTWTYDLAGQLRSETSSRNSSTVSYDYDANGNRKELRLDGSLYLTYGYDDASRLTSIVRGSGTFAFAYDDLSRRSSMTYPNGVVTSYGYDDLSRLTSISASLGTTPVTSFAYGHDDMGNRTSKVTPEATEAYDYDKVYRLTTVDRVGAGSNLFRYKYDHVGNRDQEQIGASVLAASYNQKNQLTARQTGGTILWQGHLSEAGDVTFTSATVNGKPAQMLPGNVFSAEIEVVPGTNDVQIRAVDASGNVRTSTYRLVVSGTGATYSYDPDGNLDTKVEGSTTWTYEWNATNQLKRVLSNGVEVARYSYDPLGRRVEKVAGGVTTSYVYDGTDILRETRGGTASTYIHGPRIDEPLAKDSNGTLSFFHADGLGSVVKTTDQAGAVNSSIRYDAWGNIESGSPDLYAYTAREWDAESGLYYYRARYYDPNAGRFVSQDPIAFGGGVNFYAYVAGRPTGARDPSGLIGDSDSKAFYREYMRNHPEGPPPDDSTLGAVLAYTTLALAAAPLVVLAIDVAPLLWMEAQITVGTAMVPTGSYCAVRALERTHGRTMGVNRFERLVEDIAANGVREPIKYVVDPANGLKLVVDGNHRLMAAQRLGLAEVPVQEVTLPYGGYRTVNDLYTAMERGW